MTTLGWDIGGVNTKVAHVAGGDVRAVRGRPFELQRAPERLVPLLRELAGEVGGGSDAVHAVTMTAELSQMFRTRRDGVAFVLTAVESAFPSSSIRVYTVDGRFLTPEAARREPMAVAAANWSATAHAIAAHRSDAVLIDIGTTTADIIPIVGGSVVAEGRTDPARLASGELVYSGALRTPVEAIINRVPFGGGVAGVSAEGFALAGDVHVWRGNLSSLDYTVPTPDGRPASRSACGERLARIVCADAELLDEAAITRIADAIAAAQVASIAEAVRRVVSKHPSIRCAVVTGLGAFLGASAACAAGLRVVPLAAELGDAGALCAPATCVALLLEQSLGRVRLKVDTTTDSNARLVGLKRDTTDPGSTDAGSAAESESVVASAFPPPPVVVSAFRRTVVVDTVVKLGGGVFAHPQYFEAALESIAAAARWKRLLVVPGGGPFANLARDVDRRRQLSDSAAHWIAILAMDQYAHVIADKLSGARLVTDRDAINVALELGLVPVLAPARWLREDDPLPHSWDVTSDSIAAWIAGEMQARDLVLVKPPGATGDGLVDAHFHAAIPEGVKPLVVAADRLDSWIGQT